MLNYNMQSLAFSPIPEQNPIEAYGNMLHSDGFISVSGINRRKIGLPALQGVGEQAGRSMEIHE